ncbi:MAG: phage major capsid protein [Acidobacteria bacterium]|nr:phage major capsid protein [Acidobacteriota bacterium]
MTLRELNDLRNQIANLDVRLGAALGELTAAEEGDDADALAAARAEVVRLDSEIAPLQERVDRADDEIRATTRAQLRREQRESQRRSAESNDPAPASTATTGSPASRNTGTQTVIRADGPREIRNDVSFRAMRGGAYDHNPDAPGAVIDGRWDNMAAFMRAVINREGGLVRVADNAETVSRATDGSTLDQGGALVPEEFRAELMQLIMPELNLRQRCTVLPMGSSTMTLPALRDTSRAGRTLYGGIRMYYTRPGQDIQRSQFRTRAITLRAKSLKGLLYLPNELIADSFVTLPALLTILLANARRFADDYDFLLGDGAGEPLGITNSDALIRTTRADSDGGFTLEDLGIMESRLLPQSEDAAVYIAHTSMKRDIINVAAQLGGNRVEDVEQRRLGRFLNARPVLYTDMAGPRATASGEGADSIMLLDLSFYLIGDRQMESFFMSEHAGMDDDETGFRWTSRQDGQPWIDRPVTPARGTETLSPFVSLGARTA